MQPVALDVSRSARPQPLVDAAPGARLLHLDVSQSVQVSPEATVSVRLGPWPGPLDDAVESSLERLEEDLQTALAGLGRPRLDIATLPWRADGLAEVAVFLEAEKARGRIGLAAAWAPTAEEAEGAVRAGLWDVVYVPYGPGKNHGYLDLFMAASEHGVGGVAVHEMPGPRARLPVWAQLREELPQHDPAALALHFTLAEQAVAALLVPVDTVEEVRALVLLGDPEPLPPDVREQVRRVSLGLPGRKHVG